MEEITVRHTDDLPALKVGEKITYFDESGSACEWRIDSTSVAKGIANVRTDDGRIRAIRMSSIEWRGEAENESETDEKTGTDWHESLTAGHKTAISYALAALLVFAVVSGLMIHPMSDRKKESEEAKLTQELNALNERRSEIIRSCSELREIRSQISEKTNTLDKIERWN